MPSSSRQPTIYIPHGGGPCFFMEPSPDLPRDMWDKLAAYLKGIDASLQQRPKAVLVISGHWEMPRPTVNTALNHTLLFDYYGFPEHTYRLTYPAHNSPAVVDRIEALLSHAGYRAGEDPKRGLDHGVFVPFKLIYPDADMPIIQLSLLASLDAAAHIKLGQALAPLREEGVLIAGSGNLIHNLHAYAWGRHPREPYDWAVRFERVAREMILAGEFEALIRPEALGADAALSIPTPDHYLPLLYVLGARQPDEAVQFPVEGVDGGSISMLTIQIG